MEEEGQSPGHLASEHIGSTDSSLPTDKAPWVNHISSPQVEQSIGADDSRKTLRRRRHCFIKHRITMMRIDAHRPR